MKTVVEQDRLNDCDSELTLKSETKQAAEVIFKFHYFHKNNEKVPMSEA